MISSLPTPQPGAPSLVDPRPKEEAAKALFGSAAPAAMAAAPAQQSPTDLLLLNAAAPADPDVRAVVTTENAANAKPTYLLDELAPGLKALRGETGDSVDPLAETNRLRALRGLPPIMPVASAQ